MFHVFSSLQDCWSSSMYLIMSLHDWALLVVLIILSIVGYLGSFIWKNKISFSKFLESEVLEVVWTLIPIVVLFVLSMKSLRTLYMLEEVLNSDLTVKITGHQWYWSYECENFVNQEYDSYLVPTNQLSLEGSRLLEVDKPLALPAGLQIRLLVQSEDVVHSWALPSVGLKMDAIPGRLNQMMVNISRSGILYGQCSEMCGAYHAFMPIKVECFLLNNM